MNQAINILFEFLKQLNRTVLFLYLFDSRSQT